MMSREQEIQKNVDKLLTANRESELFNRGFLKPIEICLKTWENQENQHIKEQKKGQLAYGIKQVLKADIRDNKYKLADFQPVPISQEEIQFKNLRENNWDNLVSVLKGPKQSKLKLAICICMYSEDKPMLRRTLAGVKDNIAKFVKNGISSHQIVVCVLMDGIEVVHESIIEFAEELEKESGVYLGDEVQPMKIDDILEQQNLQVDEDEIINMNKFIFVDDFDDRKVRQFRNRKKEYKESKNMIKRIEELNKDKTITFETLDSFIHPYFYKVLKQRHKDLYGNDLDLSNPDQMEMARKKYIQNTSICRPIIRQALSLTKTSCMEYITTRDSLALLNCFRVDVTVLQDEADSGARARQYNLEEEQTLFDTSRTKMNLMFVTKYKNGGKLSSHDWFFNGICKQFKPQYAVLLDVGLAPQPDALFKMIQYMQKHEKVGGVCGYMGLKIERVEKKEEVQRENVDCVTSFCMRFVDIQRAQQMQYHFAHIVDKPFESIFDFIHVLPGAFSAYRTRALQEGNSRLLKHYFQSIKKENVQGKILKKTQFTPFQAFCKVCLPDFIYFCFWDIDEHGDENLLYNQNVYLAEDRTLCEGIYENGYKLHYLPDAYAWVDPMKTLYGLLGQRKRWINGSFFAFEKVKKDLNKSNKGNCFLTIQIFYLQIMNMLAFIAPALFLFTLHIAMTSFFSYVLKPLIESVLQLQIGSLQWNSSKIFIYSIDFIYVMVFLGLIFYSMHMTNRNSNFQGFVYGASTAYGLISIAIFAILAYDTIYGLISQSAFLENNLTIVSKLTGSFTEGLALINALRYTIIGTIGLYLVPILISLFLFCRIDILLDLILSAFSFMFFGSTYLNILNIYALCRIDDISWGTKGLDTQGKGKERAENWKKIKILHVSKLVLWNGIAGYILLAFGNESVPRFYLTFVVMAFLGFTMLIKVILAIIYMCVYRCCTRNKKTENKMSSNDHVENTYKRVSNSLKSQVKSAIRDEVMRELSNNEDIMEQFNMNSIRLVSNVIKKNKPKVDSKRQMLNLFQSKISHIGKTGKPMRKQESKPSNKKNLPPIQNTHEQTRQNLFVSPEKGSQDSITLNKDNKKEQIVLLDHQASVIKKSEKTNRRKGII